jgi:acetyltransferase EpsM
MKKVIIIGAGGHAAELVDYIDYINNSSEEMKFEVIGLIDDKKENYKHYDYSSKYLGTIKEHIIDLQKSYLMAIADSSIKKMIIEEFKLKGAQFIGLIHPTALISNSAKIGEGVVISHNVSVGPKVVLGDFNVLNSRCTIGHDSNIGDYNFISPQVTVGGYSKIGNENLFGTNSCIVPNINIGNNNKVTAGMVIDKPINDNETIFYRFKEKLIVRN